MGIGKLEIMLRSLGLVDTITTVTCNALPASHVNESKKIDSVWVSSEMPISSASFCPHHFTVGDHRVIMVDFDKNTILGSD